jgi:RNA polymerase sigma-70 factor (ECF subfamily)
MKHLSDEQLIEIYKRNKDGPGQEAFACLYDRYASPMLNYFYFNLHYDYNKAQDFLHDLFLKIIEKNEQFDNNQFFKSWIYRIASNMCNNEFRSRKVIQKYNDHVISGTEHGVSEIETENDLRRCINSLNHENRSLIVLRFKMKLSVREIAEICQCPEGTIKSRLFYATKELSKLYKQ